MWEAVVAFGIFWLGICWIAVENIRRGGGRSGGHRGGPMPPGVIEMPPPSDGVQPIRHGPRQASPTNTGPR